MVGHKEEARPWRPDSTKKASRIPGAIHSWRLPVPEAPHKGALNSPTIVSSPRSLTSRVTGSVTQIPRSSPSPTVIRRGCDVAHLVLPDEVQVHPAGDEAAAGGPQGRTPLHPSAPSADAVRHAVEVAIAVDVGNNTYSFGRYFEASGQQDLVMSGHLGSIGFAFPAAMGQWALDHRGPALVEAVTNPLLVYHRDERAVPASDVAVAQCGGGGPATRVPGGSTAQSACAPQPPSNTTSVNGSRRTGP